MVVDWGVWVCVWVFAILQQGQATSLIDIYNEKKGLNND